MTAAVVDASAVLAWLLPAQGTDATRAFARRLGEFDLVAPFVFEWEVHNVLLRVRARAAASNLVHHMLLLDLALLDINVGAFHEIDDVMDLALQAGLSLFDAAYLRYGLIERLPLVSKDRALLKAASDRGVKVYDLT